jgi:hypothetical protein
VAQLGSEVLTGESGEFLPVRLQQTHGSSCALPRACAQAAGACNSDMTQSSSHGGLWHLPNPAWLSAAAASSSNGPPVMSISLPDGPLAQWTATISLYSLRCHLQLLLWPAPPLPCCLHHLHTGLVMCLPDWPLPFCFGACPPCAVLVGEVCAGATPEDPRTPLMLLAHIALTQTSLQELPQAAVQVRLLPPSPTPSHRRQMQRQQHQSTVCTVMPGTHLYACTLTGGPLSYSSGTTCSGAPRPPCQTLWVHSPRRNAADHPQCMVESPSGDSCAGRQC